MNTEAVEPTQHSTGDTPIKLEYGQNAIQVRICRAAKYKGITGQQDAIMKHKLMGWDLHQ